MESYDSESDDSFAACDKIDVKDDYVSRTHRAKPVPLAAKDLPLLKEGSEDIIQ